MSKRLLTACIPGIILTSALALGDPAPLPADPEILSLVEQVNQDRLYAVVSTLVDFHTRHTYSDTTSPDTGIGAARAWVHDLFEQWMVPAELYPWTSYWGGSLYDCYNVHGTLQGTGPDDLLIVLGGHLDSRTVLSSDTAGFAPGADDDGSGVAALLEMGRIFAGEAFPNTMVAAAFTGEEQGLLGAEAYAQALSQTATPFKAMLNLDMIGHIVHPTGAVDSSSVRCYSGGPMGSSSRQLARYVKWVGEAYAEDVTVTLYNAIDRPGRGGDHIPFYESGFPSCRLIETAEDVAYQHGPLDVPENMSFSYARKITRLAMGCAATLASTGAAPPAPEVLNAGDGESLLVSWPDTLSIPPGGFLRAAYRVSDSLYWEDIQETSDPPPLSISGLAEGVPYQISLSIANEDGLPSPFGAETPGTPIAAPPVENFETESSPTGVNLRWSPRPEPNTLEYLISRAEPGGSFSQIAAVPHPDSVYIDTDLQVGQFFYYRVQTRNEEMVTGEPSAIQEGQLASHHKGIILIDATPDGSGGVGAPPDNEVDLFYDDALSGYLIEEHWDRADSITVAETISDADLAPYKVTFVHADYNTASFGDDTTAFRKYLDNGGKLMICGWRLSYSIAGGMGYEHGYGPGDFLYDLCGIDSIRVVAPPSLEFVGAQGSLGYPDMVFDAVTYPFWGGALPHADAIWTEEFPGDVEVIATFEAASGSASAFHAKPVAFRDSEAETDWILVDAPPFYMTEASSFAFLNHALDDLGAPSGVIEVNSTQPPTRYQLEKPYPNPFNPVTRIGFELPRRSRVRLSFYDTTGRLLPTTTDEWLDAGRYEATFDGTGMASGIYLYRFTAGDFRRAGKLLLLK